MRGTAATLVCLISLHYLSVIDAYTARFTSENGMPGREHEDKHPRRSSDVKRSLSKTMRQEPDYNWENYGGIPNIPGYMYRDAYINTELDVYDEMYDDILSGNSQRPVKPGDQQTRRSDGASPDMAMRQEPDYNWEDYGGIPNIPGYSYRDAGIDADTDANKNSISKTLQRLLSPVVDAVRQLWGKLSGKSLDSAGGENTKRQGSHTEPPKKRTMQNRNDMDRETAKKRNIGNPIKYLTDIAKKALDFAYNIINKIDVSQLTEETKKLKEAVLEILKKAKEALEDLINKSAPGVESPSSRRARSVGKRTNARDALESYLTSLKSQKRSRTKSPFRRSMKGNTSARASGMTALMDLMTEMEECIQSIPPTNTSRLGVKCLVLPLVKVLSSPKPGGYSGITMEEEDFDFRSDTVESADNLRRLNFPWGSIFLIPIYNGQRPPDDTIPPYHEPRSENVTTTTTTTTTTTLPTPTTTIVYDEPDKAVRSDSKYRSKYDNDY